MRTTSINAYHEIKENGVLATLERKVLDYIKFAGPISGRLINKHIPGGWKRTAALKTMGCIEEAYEIPDPVTGHTVTYWMWRSDTPTKPRPVKRRTTEMMSEFYDVGFVAGVKCALDTVFPNAGIEIKQEMVDNVIKGMQG